MVSQSPVQAYFSPKGHCCAVRYGNQLPNPYGLYALQNGALDRTRRSGGDGNLAMEDPPGLPSGKHANIPMERSTMFNWRKLPQFRLGHFQ